MTVERGALGRRFSCTAEKSVSVALDAAQQPHRASPLSIEAVDDTQRYRHSNLQGQVTEAR